MPHQLTTKQQYWSDLLASADSSGLSMAEFATANQIKPQELYRWRNQLKKYTDQVVQPTAQFAQVVAASYSSAPALSISIAEANLQFDNLPDPDWLARLLSHQSQSI